MGTCINKCVRDEIFWKRLVGGVALILVSFKRKGHDQVTPGRQRICYKSSILQNPPIPLI